MYGKEQEKATLLARLWSRFEGFGCNQSPLARRCLSRFSLNISSRWLHWKPHQLCSGWPQCGSAYPSPWYNGVDFVLLLWLGSFVENKLGTCVCVCDRGKAWFGVAVDIKFRLSIKVKISLLTERGFEMTLILVYWISLGGHFDIQYIYMHYRNLVIQRKQLNAGTGKNDTLERKQTFLLYLLTYLL